MEGSVADLLGLPGERRNVGIGQVIRCGGEELGRFSPRLVSEDPRQRQSDHRVSRVGGVDALRDAGRSQREANDPNRHGKRSDAAHAAHEDYLENGELARDGKHQLFEGRKEHDEADRNQNKNRLDKDVAKHGHDRDRFQLEGGREHEGPDKAIRSPSSGGK